MEQDDVRRSGRKRQKQKYTVDAFAGLEDVLYSSHDSGSSTSVADSQSSGDEEFGEKQLQELAEQEEEDAAEEASLPEYETDEPEGRSEELDEELNADGEIIDLSKRSNRRGRIAPVTGTLSSTKQKTLHSRGLIETFSVAAKGDRLILAVSQEKEDLIPFTLVRDRWINALCLPPRRKHHRLGGGLTTSPYQNFTNESAGRDWRWYLSDGGRMHFRQHQTLHVSSISHIKSRPKDYPSDQPSQKFIAGSNQSPTLHNLPGGCSLRLGTSFGQTDENMVHGRSGWVLNFGSQVKCLEWSANQGQFQYLAVSSKSGLAASREAVSEMEGDPDALSSFRPQPALQSHLYIYEIMAAEGSGVASKISMEHEPRIRVILSFKWNKLRMLKFCPAPLPEPASSMLKERLGLMAGVWLDGCVRVLDIELPEDRNSLMLDVEKAAFEARPPGTVCTAVTWLSSNSIAVSCANGSVGIWSISDSIGKTNPRPWFYKSFHDAYILNIVSGYPSRPTFLFTCAIDGHTRMTDIRDPRADTITIQRQRLIPTTILWTELAQCMLNMDEAYGVSAHFLRSFHTVLNINRYTSTVLDMASSSLHPYVLVACSDGSVFSTNTITKLSAERRPPANRQRWFKHEWRRGQSAAQTMQDRSDGPSSRVDKQGILNQPLSRFTEGYKIEFSYLDNNTKPNSLNNQVFATVYETQTGIDCVTWNPNLIAGTWAAAATGNGLIRIEDIGVDGA